MVHFDVSFSSLRSRDLFDPEHFFDPGEVADVRLVYLHPDDVAADIEHLAFFLVDFGQDHLLVVFAVEFDREFDLFALLGNDFPFSSLSFLSTLYAGLYRTMPLMKGRLFRLLLGLVVHGYDEGEVGQIIPHPAAEFDELLLVRFPDGPVELDDPFLVPPAFRGRPGRPEPKVPRLLRRCCSR